MKLLIAVISKDDVDMVVSALCKERIMVTHTATVKSLLEPGTSTLFVCAQDGQVDKAIDLLKEHAGVHKRQVDSFDALPSITEEGGGVVIVVDVEKFVTL